MFVTLIGLSSSGINSAEAIAFDLFMGALTIIIAEDYAEFIGFTIKNKRPLSKSERMEIFEDTFAVSTFILVPSIIIILSKFELYSLTAAYDLSYGYCLFVLFLFSFWAGRLSNFTNRKSFVVATINALAGLSIILLKYIFTH